MRTYCSRILFGALLLVIGIGYLGAALQLWDFTIFCARLVDCIFDPTCHQFYVALWVKNIKSVFSVIWRLSVGICQ